MGKYWNKIPYTHARKANEWKYNNKKTCLEFVRNLF